jgi:glutathione S-transferase
MTRTAPIKLFQFPRMFATPNVSPFCCKLETWLRIAGIPYEVVDTPDPRKGPKGKVPFIDEDGRRMGDSTLIIEHLKRTRGVDPDAHLDNGQRATTVLVQRTIEEHYAFIVLYTHFIRDAGWQHMQATLKGVPAFLRPLVLPLVRGHMRKALNMQGTLRHSDAEIMEAAQRDWQAILSLASEPFFFGAEPATVDATLFGALATTLFTPVPSPIRGFLEGQPWAVAYAERMRDRYFPELAARG